MLYVIRIDVIIDVIIIIIKKFNICIFDTKYYC